MKNVSNWMSWQGGVDLAGAYEGKEGSMIVVHVAAMVHTPVGSAPSGMVLLHEDPGLAPTLMAFISTSQDVADYFGPNIFAGTPFESAPGIVAEIDVSQAADTCSAKVVVDGSVLEVSMDGLSTVSRANRDAGAHTPFAQQVLECAAGAVSLSVNGKSVALVVPPTGGLGEPAAAFTPAGIYSR